MDVQIRHSPSFAVARCTLTGGETLKVQPDAMIAHSPGMQLQASIDGGVMKGLKRKVLGGLAWMVLVLSIACYVAAGIACAAAFSRREGEILAPIAAFGVPLLCLSGTFFPVSIMPPFMQRFAEATPIYHMIRAMTEVTAHRATLGPIFGDVVYLTLFALAATALAALSYRSIAAAERA